MFFDWDQAQNQFLMVAHLTLQNHYTRRPIYKNIYIIYTYYERNGLQINIWPNWLESGKRLIWLWIEIWTT